MHNVFETVCRKLELRPDKHGAEEVAVTIVDFAATGILDLNGLTTATLAAAQRGASMAPSILGRAA